MDFAKFVDLLESKALFFSRLDSLGDPREGLLTVKELDGLSGRSDGMAQSIEKSRSLSFVNCWHRGTGESMAMWDLYGASACGVAIKTTMKSLKVAIDSSPLPIYISGVEYLDWKQHYGHSLNLIGMCVRKAEGYMHEDEVRLLFWEPLLEPVRVLSEEAPRAAPIDCERIARDVLTALAGFIPSCDFTTVDGRQLVLEAIVECQHRERLRNAPPGIRVSVDRSALVKEVVVGPKARPWVLDLARDVVKRYDLSVEVRPSELSAPRRPA
jgi:hypothetical protein